jgi:O-acetyl-ADP-ribose deacetylase (regulator of RNase III)
MIKTTLEIRVSRSQTILIRHGDITDEDVDVIVNAANGCLEHGGGVAEAISQRAGPGLDEESRQWVEDHGQVETGQVAVTGGGRLRCLKVIHAVGPVWQGGKKGEAAQLESAIIHSLLKAEELGMRTIALPAISSGIFGFPKDLCAEISLRTAIRFYRDHPYSKLGFVHFTNIDLATVSLFREAAVRLKLPNVYGSG